MAEDAIVKLIDNMWTRASVYFISVGTHYQLGFWMPLGINLLSYTSISDIASLSIGYLVVAVIVLSLMMTIVHPLLAAPPPRYLKATVRNREDLMTFIGFSLTIGLLATSLWLKYPHFILFPLTFLPALALTRAFREAGALKSEVPNVIINCSIIYIICYLHFFALTQGIISEYDLAHSNVHTIDYADLPKPLQKKISQSYHVNISYIGKLGDYVFLLNKNDEKK